METLEIPVNLGDFLDSSGETITMRRLPEFIDDWKSRMDRLSWMEKSQRVKSLDRFFQEWHSQYSICVQHNKRSQLLPPEVELSISILYTTLLVAKKNIFPMSDIYHSGFESSIVKDRLISDGWCQSELTRLELTETTILGLYYWSLLGRRQVFRDHTSCWYAKCLACQINPDQYKVRHVADACNCVIMTVDINKLCSILKNGVIPLISFQENPTSGKPSIELLEYKSGVNYVAISHVWADGLGNPTVNGLPLCQLRRLQARVNSVSESETLEGQPRSENIPFWMDTICVPLREKFTKHRKTALRLMAKTYEEARITLVVSLELEKCSVSRPNEELAIRMMSTSWWRRLWTLQEGVVSKNINFQFCDGTVNIDEMLKQLPSSESPFHMSSQLLNEALQELRLLYELKAKPPKKRITDFLNAVNWRSTSRLADEPTCLATILDIDPSDLLNMDKHKDRMKAFFSKQQHFPSDFIFMNNYRENERRGIWMGAQILRFPQ